jgi:hypothetical protein
MQVLENDVNYQKENENNVNLANENGNELENDTKTTNVQDLLQANVDCPSSGTLRYYTFKQTIFKLKSYKRKVSIKKIVRFTPACFKYFEFIRANIGS